MVSFSSSAVNKSGKKFAPKAPVRRAPPARKPPQPAPSSASQEGPTGSQQASPQPSQSATTSAAVSPEPPAPAVESSVSARPAEPRKPAEPEPRKNVSSGSATVIPIPQPKRKPSISAPVSKPKQTIPTPPQPTPPHTASTAEPEPEPEPPVSKEPDHGTESHARIETPQITASRENSAPPTKSPRPRGPSAPATDIRPAKRLKTTDITPAEAARPTTPHVITPPATQPQVSEVETTDTPDETASRTADEPRRAKTKRRARATDSDSAKVRRPRRPRKQREPTPEGAENVEITPTVVKMSDLCKDLRTGKMSKRETELRNMELAEIERKQNAQEDGENREQTPIKQNGDTQSPATERTDNQEGHEQSQSGPQMRIVNGEIVLDATSLQVDRHADADRHAGELEDVVENSLTRRINQSSFGKRTKAESWDDEMTDLFYRGLRMFGTDFMMISKLFPNRTRHQIKLKFNNEERRRPEKIKRTLLGPGESIDIETYSEMTNTVYDDPKEIQQELDEDKKRIEDQHAKEKEAQEEMLRNPGGLGNGAPDTTDGPVKSKPRNSKKQAAKNMGGGTEEVVGSIDDFPPV